MDHDGGKHECDHVFVASGSFEKKQKGNIERHE